MVSNDRENWLLISQFVRMVNVNWMKMFFVTIAGVNFDFKVRRTKYVKGLFSAETVYCYQPKKFPLLFGMKPILVEEVKCK